MPTQEERRHSDNVERFARLEANSEYQSQRLDEHSRRTEQLFAAQDKRFDKLESKIEPIATAFVRAGSFKAIWTLVVVSFGAVVGAITQWLLSKH
jgi:hypothetical protein